MEEASAVMGVTCRETCERGKREGREGGTNGETGVLGLEFVGELFERRAVVVEDVEGFGACVHTADPDQLKPRASPV